MAPHPAGRFSVATLPEAWFIACLSRQLEQQPLRRVVQEVPLVLFRDEAGKAAALVDRCPHRNVPLSAGCVREGQVECGYHGWRFDGGGACRAIPGLLGDASAPGRSAVAHATSEHDGVVWVYSRPGLPPGPAYRFPCYEDGRYTSLWREFSVRASLHAALENTLDVPHTAFLHGGLFRSSHKRNDLEVVVRRSATSVEAEYLGEPRPSGLVGRLLAPGGGVVTHFDRFLLPSLAQVEYRLGEASHLVTTSAMTPVSSFETRIFAVVTLRVPAPGWLARVVLEPVVRRIFSQDAAMLRLQTDNLERFGGESYVSTELDVLGPHVWLLLKNASRGADAAPVAPLEHRSKMQT